MSNIYIQEPPTSGKVILKTTVGEIDIELWSKETPKSCRNFIQLCQEGYFNDTIFHRVLPGFIVQGGDPTGTGDGGESIYDGKGFKDEFHSRLRFNRRGLVGMANGGQPNDNQSQFFFTLAPCEELNKKNTLFGKVVGNTLFNMLKLEEGELVDERPIRPNKIISTEVVLNPFNDIKPRTVPKLSEDIHKEKEKEKSLARGIKNFGLLSFGEEAEEEEQGVNKVLSEFKVKGKSAHDLANDPKLARLPAIELSSTPAKESDEKLKEIQSKLVKQKDTLKDEIKIEAEDIHNDKQAKAEKIKEEIKELQKEIYAQKRGQEQEKVEKVKQESNEIDVVKAYKEDVGKYEHLKRKKTEKSETSKENMTLKLLESFKHRLFDAKNTLDEEKEQRETTQNDLDSILTHKLDVNEEIHQKVIDANKQELERYDIYDPRNELNKRKRGDDSSRPRKKH